MTQIADVQHSGLLTGIGDAKTGASRPLPRLGVYGLGQIGAPVAGGSTSRVGADLSLPIAPTAAFFATFHPDYSNVEIDQQTISPTPVPAPVQRGAALLHPGRELLQPVPLRELRLTRRSTRPAIPTPRDGYAFEGRSGRFAGAGFESIGDQRIDRAAVASYSDPAGAMHVSAEHVDVRTPQLHRQRHGAGYLVHQPAQPPDALRQPREPDGHVRQRSVAARRTRDAGAGIGNATSSFYAVLRRLGPQFSPADGYVQQSDVAGYAVQRQHDPQPHPRHVPQRLALRVRRPLSRQRRCDRPGRLRARSSRPRSATTSRSTSTSTPAPRARWTARSCRSTRTAPTSAI